MSLHENLMLAMYFPLSISLMWKWSKTLLMIVNLEVISVFILAFFIMEGIVTSMLLLMMVFFVSEALILLSAMFSSMRTSGLGYSLTVMW